ncbi:hypothetical protein BpHYR1_032904 [Brachionus plicatilis]|uniref:Uncharacterized protein n=1 Tax=Brachionus plicatilis TaxID=10195 RepID=A0A3M7P2L6_BRAPC|nr:hypothetical protein BpHYR1_032904 [Brachionus plicatilis]
MEIKRLYNFLKDSQFIENKGENAAKVIRVQDSFNKCEFLLKHSHADRKYKPKYRKHSTNQS